MSVEPEAAPVVLDFAPTERMKPMKLEAVTVRPQVVRDIALWWQGELDRFLAEGREAPDLPSHPEVMERFGCEEEESLRGVSLGEHRHFSGIE